MADLVVEGSVGVGTGLVRPVPESRIVTIDRPQVVTLKLCSSGLLFAVTILELRRAIAGRSESVVVTQVSVVNAFARMCSVASVSLHPGEFGVEIPGEYFLRLIGSGFASGTMTYEPAAGATAPDPVTGVAPSLTPAVPGVITSLPITSPASRPTTAPSPGRDSEQRAPQNGTIDTGWASPSGVLKAVALGSGAALAAALLMATIPRLKRTHS